MTPEGKVKKAIKEMLARYDIQSAKDAGKFTKAAGWYYMPVPSVYSVRGIPDFVGGYLGNFFAIEAKAPGKESTNLQLLQINSMRAGTLKVFVVDSVAGINEVEKWLQQKNETKNN